MVADIQDKSFKMIMSSDIIIYNVLWIGMTNPHKQELRVGSTMVASREACKSLESLAEVGGRGCLYLLLTRTRNQDLNTNRYKVQHFSKITLSWSQVCLDYF